MTMIRTLTGKARGLTHWAARTFLRPDSIVILDRQPLPLRTRDDLPA